MVITSTQTTEDVQRYECVLLVLCNNSRTKSRVLIATASGIGFVRTSEHNFITYRMRSKLLTPKQPTQSVCICLLVLSLKSGSPKWVSGTLIHLFWHRSKRLNACSVYQERNLSVAQDAMTSAASPDSRPSAGPIPGCA